MHLKIEIPSVQQRYNNGTDCIPFFEMHCSRILLYNIISKYTNKTLAGLSWCKNHHSILLKNLLWYPEDTRWLWILQWKIKIFNTWWISF